MKIDLTVAQSVITEWAADHPTVAVEITSPEQGDEPFLAVDVNSNVSPSFYTFNLHDDAIIRCAEYDEDSTEEETAAHEIVINSLLHRLNDVFGVRTVKGLFLDAANNTESGMI